MKRLLRRLPWFRELHAYIRALEAERDALRGEVAHWKTWMSPGHFYSPIPSIQELKAREAQVWPEPPRSLPGIELNVEAQLALVRELAKHEVFFPRTKGATRYWFENPAYSFGDAIFLSAMLRHLRPKRVIEIGSGFSSAAMLDTNEEFLDRSMELTFIDPDLTTLESLLRPADDVEAIGARVQDVPLSRFEALESGDVLFVDSTHVSKAGSDVNHILFEIVPRLKQGVYIHFHDVFYPFEYPKEWVYEGRAWNEDYLLRAFLTFNRAFEIVLFSQYLAHFHRDVMEREMPLVLENPGGALWLRRRATGDR